MKRVIKDLKEQGILVVGCFNKKGFDRTGWYRADYVALTAALHNDEDAPIVPKWPHASGQNGTIHSAKMAPTIPEMNTEKNTESFCVNATAKDKSPSEKQQAKLYNFPVKKETEPDLLGEEKMATAKEILQKQQEKNAENLRLSSLWKKRKHLETEKLVNLTAKENAQLKRLQILWKGNAVAVMGYAWDHWMLMASVIKAKAGLQIAPIEPHIGFLVVHWEAAEDAYLQSIAPEKPMPVTKPVAVTQPVAIPENMPYKPSQDEIAATLAMLGGSMSSAVAAKKLSHLLTAPQHNAYSAG